MLMHPSTPRTLDGVSVPTPTVTSTLTGTTTAAPTTTSVPDVASTASAATAAAADAAATAATEVWKSDLVQITISIAVTVLVAVLVRLFAHRMIDRLTEGIATGAPRSEQRGWRSLLHRSRGMAIFAGSSALNARREQRARTTASVLKSATTAFVGVTALMTALGTVGVNVQPLLASAGVVGVALGFGAQTIVKDFIAGMFMLIEDQYGVGDSVDLGTVTGTVEALGLRVTKLRADDGTLWYVRNGEILKVGNLSQGWGKVVLDVRLALEADIDKAQDVLLDVARALRDDLAVGEYVVEEPQLLGIETIAADGCTLRLAVKTVPGQKAAVARELRRRIKGKVDSGALQLAASPAPA